MIGQIAGNVAGSLIGGYFGNKAAKHQAAADRYAVDQQMRPFLLKEPFLKDLYSGAQGALNNALNTGAFTGPTYAGLDPMQMRGITGMGAFGDRALGLGSSFMDQGMDFAQNAQSLFDSAGGRTLDDAVNYASSSPHAQSLIDAACRTFTASPPHTSNPQLILKEKPLPPGTGKVLGDRGHSLLIGGSNQQDNITDLL